MTNTNLINALQWYSIMECDYVYDAQPTKINDMTESKGRDAKFGVNKSSGLSSTNNKVSIAIQESRMLADKAATLEELRGFIANFTLCELRNEAKNTVFADGNQHSSVMAIGEAPGASEDSQGIPFCGDSGKLLDKMFASIDFSREKNLYITNTVFWRPPNNRRPTNEELDVCRPFVEKHIALIKPKLLILVGATALEALLQVDTPITKARQKFFEYRNQYMDDVIPATPIFHPAYLLRQPNQKKLAWEDLLNIQNWLNNS